MSKRIFIVFITLVFLVLPIFFYYDQFGSRHFSADFRDWSEFSTFYNLFVSLFTGVILMLLTWKIHQENMDLNKPLLVFSIRGAVECPHVIKNIGNGPAINIDIYHSSSETGWIEK